MRSVYPIIAVALTGAGVAVAQDNPLNGFISQAGSLASQLASANGPSSQPSQTASDASRTSLSGSQASSAASAASASAASVASSQSLALFNPPPTPTAAASSTAPASGAAASQTAAPASSDNGGGGLSARDKGIIAGCVVGGVLLLAVLAALICCCCLRRRRRRRREKKDWEKRGLRDSHEAVHSHREAYETHRGRHGNFSSVTATPRQSSSALPRHSGVSDHDLVAGPPYGHHNHPMPENHHGLGTATGGAMAAAAVSRHSGAHDRPSRNPFSGFAGKHRGHHDHHSPYDHPDHRMSGGSAPLLGNSEHPAYRNSAGSNFAGAGIHDPGSPVSMNNGVKRRPVPDESHDHHGAALGAGAVGAMAGAAAYKHHHDKKRGSGVSNGDYIEDNNRYSTGSASSLRRSQEAHRSQEVPPPMPTHQHDSSRFPPLLPTHHDTHQSPAAHMMTAHHDAHQPSAAHMMPAHHDAHQPSAAHMMPAHHDAHQPSAAHPMHDDEYRPPTPFGLAALGSHSPHRTSHGSPPTYPDPPFAATRRSGSFPDPTVSDHSQHYPGHHVSGDPRRSSHGSSGPLAAGAAGAAAGVAAGAIGSTHHQQHHHDHQQQQQQQQHPFRRSNGSIPDPPIDDHNRTYPYHHTAAPPTNEQRRSLQDRGFSSSGEHIAYEPTDHHGRSKRHSMPDTYNRSRSNSAPRVPPAAIGAVGRDSPRVTASDSPPFNGHGNGHGGSANDLHRLSAPVQRPQYPGQPSYSSYYSDAPTPGDDIPGAFPHDDRPSRSVGHGMREHRRSEGDSPARSNGRRLRFSDRHEEWEFADGDRPQDASVGRAY